MDDYDCETHLPTCYESGGSCEFLENRSISCNCKFKTWDPESEKCLKKCSEDRECPYGEKCAERLCKCPDQDSGSKCEELSKEKCETSLEGCIASGGSCEYSKQKEIICYCRDKIWDVDFEKCIDDHCGSGPCQNRGSCKNTEDSYECKCVGRFQGDNCETAVCDESEKEMCGNVSCEFDKPLSEAFCICNYGEEFDVESKSCKAIDGCFMKMLNNECNKSHETCNEWKCQCEKNYKYSEDSQTCEENFCGAADSPCPANSDCRELGSGNVHCDCKKGYFWQGTTCAKLNPCSPGMSNCQQVCNAKTGKCSCYKGFTMNEDGKTCIRDKDDTVCELECGGGTCVKENGKDKCKCPSVTHINNGTTCIDKCTYSILNASASMCPTDECELDDQVVFRCKCEDPYEQAWDGIHCRRKIMCENKNVTKECAAQLATCKEVLSGKGYECVCEDGFAKNFPFGICTKKCDISGNIDMCASNRALCELDKNYDVVCKCPPMLKRGTGEPRSPCDTIATISYLGKLSILKYKYQLEESKSRFADEIDIQKLEGDMTESMKKIYGNGTELNILRCNVVGDLVSCSIELQFEERPRYDRMALLQWPSICLPLDEEYCVVKPSLILKRERYVLERTYACNKEIREKLCGKSTNCKDWFNEFQCTCKKGFYAIGSYNPGLSTKTFIQTCNDIDECANPSACPNSTECINTYGDYDCTCRDGFKRKEYYGFDNPKENGCTDICDPNPCYFGKCVNLGNDGFSCDCYDFATGMLCLNIREIPIGAYVTQAIASLLGILFLITLIIVLVLYRKLKKFKANAEVCDQNGQTVIPSEMDHMRHAQSPMDADKDIELHRNDRTPSTSRRDSGEDRREFTEDRMIPQFETYRKRDDDQEIRNIYPKLEMSDMSSERAPSTEAKGVSTMTGSKRRPE